MQYFWEMQPPGGKRHAVSSLPHSRVEIFRFHHPATERGTRAEHIAGAFIMVLPRSLCSMTLCPRVCVGERTCFFLCLFLPVQYHLLGVVGVHDSSWRMKEQKAKGKKKRIYMRQKTTKPPRGSKTFDLLLHFVYKTTNLLLGIDKKLVVRLCACLRIVTYALTLLFPHRVPHMSRAIY